MKLIIGIILLVGGLVTLCLFNIYILTKKCIKLEQNEKNISQT